MKKKIKVLFHTTFKELPTVLYFDDFEQNLIRHGDIHQIKPEALEVLNPLFYAFDLYKSSALEIDESDQFKGLTNLLITSRYPFVMEVDGRDLAAETLEDIPLMSFKGADLIKRKMSCRTSKKANTAVYIWNMAKVIRVFWNGWRRLPRKKRNTILKS